ncbi:MAG: DUF58 domain-containing protein [Oscillospiraceae bacterium]|nr:DUF58 domain-containing protein [Oscillospiraceae bacterium]
MREFKIFFFTLIFLLLLMCFTYHSRLMPLMLLTVTLICLSSFLLGLFARLRLQITTEKVPGEVFRKNQINMTVSIKNKSLLPLTPVRIYVKVCEKGKYLPQNKVLISSIPPLGDVTFSIQNFVSYRGEYSLGIEQVEFFDILKIFRYKINRDTPWKLTSYLRELTSDNIGDYNQDEEEATRTKAHGFNKDAFSHLREYREGDSLRRIHWKLSARLDELIVKQMETNHNYSSLIFCDFTWDLPDSQNSPNLPDKISYEAVMSESDMAIETSLAIIRRILLTLNTAVFLWQDNRTKECEVREVLHMQDCGELANSLAFLPAAPFDGDFTDLFDEFSEEVRLERAIYIVTPNVTDDLVEKLYSTGLILRRNVVLAVIAFDSDSGSQQQHDRIEYLSTKTAIQVCQIKTDDESAVKNLTALN